MDRVRRDLLRGLGVLGLSLAGAGCEAAELFQRTRPEARRIGCPMIVSPICPAVLIDISTDLTVLHNKRLTATDYYVWGFADDPSQLAELLVGQLRAGARLILALGTPAIQAAAAATTSVPIVAVQLGDGPDAGVLERLARPGGNLTGVAAVAERLPERQFELLRQARPDARRVGLLWRPGSTWPDDTPARVSAAAERLGLELLPFELRSPSELEQVIGAAGRADLAGLLLLAEWQTNRLFPHLAALAAAARLALISPYRRFAELGALLAFGPLIALVGRAAAEQVSKVLDGAAPSSLPIQRVDDVELAVNPIAARRVGVTFPRELLARASEVVEQEIVGG